ncbi:MAG: hypothetical protein AAF636_05515 [Pseudomonadota bacterium]
MYSTLSFVFFWVLLLFVGFSGAVSSQVPESNYWPDLSKPMEFRLAATGGNCNSCTWISAQGMITRETPRLFQEFVDQIEGEFEGTNLHLNSLGGDLGSAIILGRMIRETGFGTVVAETAGYVGRHDSRFLFDQFLDTDDPVCVSACVFAFAGGTNRAASQRTGDEKVGYQKVGRLAVHQFYSLASDGENFGSEERVNDQIRTGVLLEYSVEMGISADLLARALAVPPQEEMYWLTEEDIKSFGMDTFVSDFSPTLRGYSNGVGIVELKKRTRRGDYRYEFFCSPQRQAMMKLTLSVFEWPKPGTEAWRNPNWQFNLKSFIDSLKTPLPGSPVLTSWGQKTTSEGYVAVEMVFSSGNATVDALVGQTDFRFWHDGGSYASFLAADMNFLKAQPFDGFYLLPRLCLN